MSHASPQQSYSSFRRKRGEAKRRLTPFSATCVGIVNFLRSRHDHHTCTEEAALELITTVDRLVRFNGVSGAEAQTVQAFALGILDAYTARRPPCTCESPDCQECCDMVDDWNEALERRDPTVF